MVAYQAHNLVEIVRIYPILVVLFGLFGWLHGGQPDKLTPVFVEANVWYGSFSGYTLSVIL